MRRRQFIFRSLKAAALLSPVLSIRQAAAAEPRPLIGFVWVNCCGYPDPADFFPTGDGDNFVLSPILADFESLRGDMIVVDGVDIRDSGLNPKGNNHVRTVGKVLTAKDVLPAADSEDGLPGGISVDQLIASQLGVQSLELQVDSGGKTHMRSRPFATGPNAFKTPFAQPIDAWNKLFQGFQADDPAALEAQKRRLRLKKSILDDVTEELTRLRKELAGVEKLKLDIHEDALRKAEKSVTYDLENSDVAICEVPESPGAPGSIPARATAMLDITYAAMLCGRAQVIGMLWGYSGYHWRYEWVPIPNVADSGHDEVHHNPGGRRQDYRNMARWDWNQLRGLLERLKNTPDGEGTMLDNVLTMAISHFGVHHQMKRIPVAFFGNAQGQLQTGRLVKVQCNNDRALTSFANLMGAPIAGIGDDPNCGPLPL
ncbi:MAG: DUF1552 domain-containing protein [Myxococcales bacterium]|nr:DUF1552 domain-containing protein [Myxococcales bacterium]